MDPKFIAVALQVGRALPWRWAAPALAVVALGAGLGIQLLGRRAPPFEEADEELQAARDRLRQAEQKLKAAEDEARRGFAKAA
jgi:hypothetical protein